MLLIPTTNSRKALRAMSGFLYMKRLTHKASSDAF